MCKYIEQAGEFHRYAGPREMYGFVILKAIPANHFSFKSSINWPPDMSAEIYDRAVYKGIERALDEVNVNTGDFELIEISLSDNYDANVAFAFGEASYIAAKKNSK